MRRNIRQQKVRHQRRRDLIRQVRAKFEAETGVVRQFFAQDVQHVAVEAVFIFENIGEQKSNIVFVPMFLFRHFVHRRVDFDRNDASGFERHRAGQRAGAGADFENDVVFVELRRLVQQVQKVQVDKEVLAEFAARVNPERLETLHQIRPRLVVGRTFAH